MAQDNVDAALSTLAFDFFHAFARFEFALKQNGYLRDHRSGAVALPGWDEFVAKFAHAYQPSAEAHAILNALPEQQVVDQDNTLAWRKVDLSESGSELESLIKLLKTIRNNLFHGGKHSAAGWDAPERAKLLLANGLAVLHQLAAVSSLEADFFGRY